jgi:superfamily II DNA or RNA helicase/DNA-binding PadR family transcriptional regulator
MTLPTQLVLRALLAEPTREMYGLQIREAAGLPSGTIHPILARFEGLGWLESRWEDISPDEKGRPRRRYYRLTGDGAEQARAALAEVIEQPNLLEAVDRITPENVAERFRELPNDIGDDGRDSEERAGMLAGERVRRAATGEDGVVLSAGDGALVHVAFASGTVWVDPEDLEKLPAGPAERLAVGDFGHAEPYGLRLQSLYLKHAYRYDPLTGLSSARIEPQLHQVFVAHRVAQKLQPRMILADEVGLGKTIEAGLIVKELRARELIDRVLIVVPASLQLQWQSELRSKFNEEFEILDGAAVQYLGRGGRNPWMARPNVICSLPFAANPKRAEQIIEAEWDMVIFDEAHRVRRHRQGASKTRATQAYRLADELKELVNGLLLLTATPMQLDPFELYSLIELVEPGLFPSYRSYDSLRAYLPRLNALMKDLKSWNALSDAERAESVSSNAAILGELGVRAAEAAAVLAREEGRERLMDGLVDKHPIAGALVRNRKAEVGGFTSREARKVPVTLEDEELALYEDVAAYLRDGYNRALAQKNNALGFLMVGYQKMLASSSYAVRQSFRRRIEKLKARPKSSGTRSKPPSDSHLDELRDAEEITQVLTELEDSAVDPAGLVEEISQLQDLVDRLGGVRDSKAQVLLTALDGIFTDHPREKVVVFTTFIQTQRYLAATLRHNGYTVAEFNGQMSLDEKEEAVRGFKASDQILISTEAGGEGRNFQFCHLMVNYDLPWNPMLIEQRIGRLDRIGQKKPVLIYNLFCVGTVEERVIEVLERRIGLFEESVGSLDPILGEVERDIERLVLADVASLDKEFQRLEHTLERRVREAREKERTLADFVLDRASLRRDTAAELLNQSPLARWPDLESFAVRCLIYYGGTLKRHYEGGEVASLSPRLMARMRQRQSTIHGTFDPEIASNREDLPFFAFGHWLVDSLAELPLTAEPVVTAVRRAPDVPPGEWVEVYYEIRSEGARPRGWFLRHLVGPDLAVWSERVTAVPAVGEPVLGNRLPGWASAALDASRRQFEVDYGTARASMRADNDAVRDEALERAERIYGYRRLRLTALIEEQDAWITEKEAYGSERERRVLPARRGQVAKNRERLSSLQAEHEIELDEIRRRQPSPSAAVLAAGVVIGG